jgi:hypothetical protein
MTLQMFPLDLSLAPYTEQSFDAQFFQLLGIPTTNTYRIWLEAALDELRQKGYWYVIGYCLDSCRWTLFYHRRKSHPSQIFMGARENAFRGGRCSTGHEELHFFDLDYGRPAVDYGKHREAA